MHRLRSLAFIGALCAVAACDTDRIGGSPTPAAPLAAPASVDGGNIIVEPPDDGTGGASSIGNERFGFNIVGITDLSDANRRTLLSYARDAGFKFVRLPIGWMDFERQEGVYDLAYLAQLDQTMQELRDYGLTPLLNVMGSPCWAQEFSETCDAIKAPHRNYMSHWQSFVSFMVARYPDVQYWGVGNEPNGFMRDPYWATDACPEGDWLAAYDEVFKSAADVIQPAGKILVGPFLGIGGAPSSNPSCNETEGETLSRFVALERFRMRPQDIYAVHAYQTGEAVRDRLRAYDTVLAAYGETNAVWVTEYGSSPWEADDHVQTFFNTSLLKLFRDGGYLPPRVTKVFKFTLWQYPGGTSEGYGVINVIPELVGLGDPQTYAIVPRPAYYCLRQLARYMPLSSYCTAPL